MDTTIDQFNNLIDKADSSAPPKSQKLWRFAIRFAQAHPEHAFSKTGQSWRDLKVKKLRACCYLLLNQIDKFKF